MFISDLLGTVHNSRYRRSVGVSELMSQMSEFLESICVLTVQVKSRGQRLFLEHVDQGLREGRDQWWLCIVHNAKFSFCDGHCCCHLMSSTQNNFVV